MSKPITLIFVGIDGDAAKKAALEIRAAAGTANLRSAEMFDGSEIEEDAAHVVIMSDVAEPYRGRIAKAYAGKLLGADAPPPPPPPFDPLANLGDKWRERPDLRELAATVAGGRAVENNAQAVAIIEDALKARRKGE